MKSGIWKSGALALALGAALFVPQVAQADDDDRREERQERREDRRERKQERRENRRERRQERRENRYENGYNNGRYNGGRYNDRYDRNRYNTRSFTGVVTRRRAANRFDVRIDGKGYNVYLNDNVSRQIDRDDIVRIFGVREGDNNIRQASLSLLRNR